MSPEVFLPFPIYQIHTFSEEILEKRINLKKSYKLIEDKEENKSGGSIIRTKFIKPDLELVYMSDEFKRKISLINKLKLMNGHHQRAVNTIAQNSIFMKTSSKLNSKFC